MKHEEKDLEQRCSLYARQQGWVMWKNEKDGHKGIPDRSLLSPDGSRFLFVEFKKDTHQRPRPEQAVWLARFPSIAYLIGSYDDFVSLISE